MLPFARVGFRIRRNIFNLRTDLEAVKLDKIGKYL